MSQRRSVGWAGSAVEYAVTTSSDQLREITEALVAMAGLDFSVTPTVRQDGSALDAVAVGLRALAEELQAALQARQVAEQSNRSKAQFLANMSHELRTPLTTVIGVADLLATSSLTPQQRRDVDRLAAATVVLQRLIEDVLDFSRLEVGSLQFRSETFSIGEVCRRVRETHAADAAEKGLSISLYLSEETEDVLIGDPLRVQQVVSNLVSNAVKYTRDGQVQFGVGPRRRHGQTLIWVEDTGPGIPLDRLERIFDRFETGVMGGGIGLGLNIVQLLVARMNGTVRCVARTGPGARFEVSLPLTVPKCAAPPVTSRSAISVERVLVVDDTAVVRAVAEDMLKTCGCEVVAVGSGAEAIAMLESGEDIDLILMDCLMPIMDGVTTAREILQRWPELRGRIVAMSAHTSSENREERCEAGMTHTLDKPFRLAELEALISRI